MRDDTHHTHETMTNGIELSTGADATGTDVAGVHATDDHATGWSA